MSKNLTLSEESKRTSIDEIKFNKVKLLKERFSIDNQNSQQQHKILIDLKKESFKKDISYPLCRTDLKTDVQSNQCIESLIESINWLAFDVYNHKSTNSFDNVVISPLSLFYMLKVLYLSSTNQTEEELSKLLHLESNARFNKSLLEKSFIILIENLKNSVHKNKDLFNGKTRSKFVLKSEAHVKDNFLQDGYKNVLKNSFKFDLHESSSSLNLMNDKILDKYEINKNDQFAKDDLFIILNNLIEFNFDWKMPFDVTVEKATFTKSNNQTVKTELMRLNNFKFLYAKHPKGLPIRICEFPFSNENFAFTILLPENNCLTDIDNMLNLTLFNQIIDEMKLTEVNSILPKFKITDRSNLIKILQSLHIDSLIDFKHRDHGLCFDKAIYNCEINVGYNSVMGSAETDLILSRNPDVSNDPNLFVHSCEKFDCTNPFIFFVRDVKTKLIIYMGKLLVPTNISQ
jgi:serine protease inhibitor